MGHEISIPFEFAFLDYLGLYILYGCLSASTNMHRLTLFYDSIYFITPWVLQHIIFCRFVRHLACYQPGTKHPNCMRSTSTCLCMHYIRCQININILMDADTTGNIHKMISKLKLHIGECIKTDSIILTDLFVCIDALRTIQHFFRHVRTFPVSLGWTSTKQRINCFTQGHNAVPLGVKN